MYYLEAGLGSSVMVHSNSNVKEPVTQGMWGIFEVFADTMVVCTLTTLIVLTTRGDVANLYTTFEDVGTTVADSFNGLMMLPNLIGVIVLSPLVMKITKNYIDRRLKHKDIEPMLSVFPEIQKEHAKAVKETGEN